MVSGFKTFGAAVVALALSAGASLAATVTETFDFTGNIPEGSYNASLQFTGSLGTVVTVTAGTYPVFTYDYTEGGSAYVGQWTGYGLGVSSSRYDTNHRVDGSGLNDILLFSFDSIVDVASLTFGSYYHGSMFDLFGSDQPAYEDCCNLITPGAVDVSGLGISGDVIGVGAFFSGSAFKVRGMSITYDDTPPGGNSPVPLPAGGVLIVTGLGAMGLLRRRKAQR